MAGINPRRVLSNVDLPMPLLPVNKITSPIIALKFKFDKIILFPAKQLKDFTLIELILFWFLKSIYYISLDK